jgi:serine protease Do
LATDSYFDIAVIKVEGNNLPVVELGDSEKLKIGQTVIAIGNSLGEFRNTVSKGIISGLKRNVDAGDGRGRTETLEAVIQTDAAINPGNSGGPLLDLSGKVIGINVAMAQGAENIGFSIPVNEVKDIYQSVKTTGKIARPYIGVRYMIITDEFSKENNLSVDYGALIVRGERITDLAVIPGSPADKAGLLENDIILEVDGVKINEENDLSRIVRRKKVGDTLRLKILSKGKEKEVALVLEEADN